MTDRSPSSGHSTAGNTVLRDNTPAALKSPFPLSAWPPGHSGSASAHRRRLLPAPLRASGRLQSEARRK
ncbi:unnamed protein product [Boreogadus saida]